MEREKSKKKLNMKLVTVHLPPAYIEGLRELVKRGRYPNQSEAIRAAVRDLLREELWRREKVEPIFLEA